jgi:glycerol uptake facilitator protein
METPVFYYMGSAYIASLFVVLKKETIAGLLMEALVYEFLGTALLILLGNGVVANVLLPHSKGQGGGWIVIAFGWAMAVFAGVYISSGKSGGHLNPAVTLSMAYLGRIDWLFVPGYMAAQLAGAFAGAVANWLVYKKHFDAAADAAAIQGIFCTAPAIRSGFWNLVSEALATFAFMVGVLFLSAPSESNGSLDALPVALLVLAIGLSLGGPTGYAINPARDLGPRLAHFLLPIPGKKGSGWGYAWVPILGPVIGGALATWLFHALQ